MLGLEPSSTDTQRFLADGLNVAHGKNPYTAAPPIEIKYGHLRSFYPPLQEIVFGAAALVHPSPFVFRILGGLAELAFLIWFFWRKRQKQTSKIVTLFLLFNPLSIHEIWREGHVDHIGVIFLYFAILNIKARTRWRAFFYTALGIAWKFAGIFAVAYRRQPAFVIFAASIFAVQLIPAVLFTPFAENGLTVYRTYWHHGNGIVHLLQSMGFAAPHAIYLIQWSIALLTMAVGVLFLLRRIHVYDAFYFSLGSMLVLFPVQHPWYYFLLFPAVLLSPRWRNLTAAICCLAPLSYLGYTENFKSAGFIIVLAVWGSGSIFHFTRHKISR